MAAGVPSCVSLTLPEPDWVCVNNGTQWVANSSQTISTSQLNLTVPLVVVGNLTVSNNSTTLVAVYNGSPVLNISGVADLHGTLLLVLQSGVMLTVPQQITIGYTADLQHAFDSVILESSNGCVRYTSGAPEYSLTDLSFGVLVESVSNTCSSSGAVHWWVFVIAVVGALLLIVVLIGVGVYLQRKGYVRRLFRRMQRRRTPLDNSPL